MKKTIVIGSGLAGMSAAYRLQQAGREVLLLEAGSRSGGRVLSFEKDGFIVDAGPTLITDNYVEYLKLVDELGLNSSLVDSAAIIGIVKQGELHLIDADAPLSGFLKTGLLTVSQKLTLVMKGLSLIKPLHKLNPYELSSHVHYDNESMENYLNRIFGKELNDALLASVARGVTLSTPEDASVIEFFAGAVAAAGKMKNLLGGMGVLPDALSEQLDIRLQCQVTAVTKTAIGVQVNYRNENGDVLVEDGDDCLITTRFRDAVNLYPPLKKSGEKLFAATDYTGCYSMQLFYDRRTQKQPFIIMVPVSDSAEVSAVFLEHMKAPDRAPEGKSQLTLFFNLASDIDFTSWSDEQFITTGRNFIETLFPELDNHYLDSHITRWDYAAHMGNVGYYAALDEFLTNHSADDPVQVAGDWMAVSGQESAVIAGVKAAQRLLART